MKRIVITGATSFIGVSLIEYWLKRDCQVYAVIRPNSTNANRLPASDRVKIVELEMRDYHQIAQHIQKADVFYHLAWEGARAPHRDNPVMQEENYNCAVMAMNMAQAMGCSLFVGAGSQAEYGKISGPVDENYPCNPNTEYGRYKLKTSQTLRAMADECGMRFVWMRIFSLYGKYDCAGTLVMSAIDKMSKNEPMQMTACTQKWDYLFVKDAVQAMVAFAETECESGVYHIANGDIRPLREYVEEIKSVLGSDSVIDFGAVSYGPAGPVNLEPVVTKTQKALGWRAETKFADGIKKLLAYQA